MTVGAGDPRRARTAATEAERSRTISTVRRCGTDGLLSSRQVEEHLERAFRAKTLADLDTVVSDLPYSPYIAAEVVRAHGLRAPAAGKPPAPWWRGIVAWVVALDVLWVVIWIFTGGAVGWLVLAIVSSTAAFTVRFVARHRRQLLGKPARRRRR